MEEIYNYIAIQFRSPENAIGQYNRIAEAIEGFPYHVIRQFYNRPFVKRADK